ncbi:MAG TPA: radical SAM protein [Syntrophales bacterium]|nr:radical SAM protein [Syntrophales bacterium]HOL59658.1 radical SAM protein [Syntrophales bacterium]HPO35804.1 radical SAM protein [Syntrophales bacterium]
MKLWVNEIFYSLQGESSHAGRPCVFVRLTGCNLRCRYCDTTYAYDEGTLLDIDEIKTRLGSFGCNLVEITGGEPLLQPGTPKLIKDLLDGGWEVLIETNGSLNIGVVDERSHRIMDVKLPSSGEHRQMRWENMDFLTPKDEVKFVVVTREDYEYAKDVIERYSLGDRPLSPLLSPVFGLLNFQTLADWILRDRLRVRMQIPLHKVIWGERRGV